MKGSWALTAKFGWAGWQKFSIRSCCNSVTYDLYSKPLFVLYQCMETQTNNLKDTFLAPALDALSKAKHSRSCSDYTDSDFLKSGIERVLQNVTSGRDWVQRLRLKFNLNLSVSNFFNSLRSSRRKQLVEEISLDVRSQTDQIICNKNSDPLSAHPELRGFAVYASDGHSHKPSAHETAIADKKRAVTHIYTCNLRSHSLAHTALTNVSMTKKKEHEIATLKQIGGKALRMGEAKGTKVIQVYDPAIIDYQQWFKWKKGHGVYILTLEKSNSALQVLGQLQWDKNDERNQGVLNDELVGPSNGVTMRRVTYKDPLTGKTYRFITNELTLPPGLIAFLYKLRWDIEKIFDQIKNKLLEQKAWAKSATAKIQQANFVTIAHNLMVLLKHQIETQEGIVDEKNKRKREQIRAQEIKKLKGQTINPMVINWNRATQRCLQFIRWLRHCLDNQTPWSQAMELLRPLMQKYLH